MAVDTVLWVIFAAIAALIYCGCVFTRPAHKRMEVGRPADQHRLDRAA